MANEENAMVQEGYWADGDVSLDSHFEDRRDAEADATEDDALGRAWRKLQAGIQTEREHTAKMLAEYRSLITEQHALIERLQAQLEES